MHFQEHDTLTAKIETWLKKSQKKPKVRFDTATGEGLEAAWELVKKINKMQKLNLKLPNLSRMVVAWFNNNTIKKPSFSHVVLAYQWRRVRCVTK